MLHATTRFGDDLRPNFEDSERTAKRAAASTRKRGHRFAVISCPNDEYERGVWFWPSEVLMTAAYAGFPSGTTLEDPAGGRYTVEGREVIGPDGEPFTSWAYEQEMAQTWVVVSAPRPEHRRGASFLCAGDVLRSEDVAAGMRRGTLEGARIVVPVGAPRHAGEVVLVHGGRLTTADGREVRTVGLTASGPARTMRRNTKNLLQ